MSTDEYVPSEADLRLAWSMFRGHNLDSNPDYEFHTAMARVRRDAAREAEERIAEEKRLRMKATAAATEAEARICDLTQEAKDERGAALDQMEQVKIRDARIKAVRDVLDRKLPPSARTLAAEVHRALESVPPPSA